LLVAKPHPVRNPSLTFLFFSFFLFFCVKDNDTF